MTIQNSNAYSWVTWVNTLLWRWAYRLHPPTRWLTAAVKLGDISNVFWCICWKFLPSPWLNHLTEFWAFNSCDTVILPPETATPNSNSPMSPVPTLGPWKHLSRIDCFTKSTTAVIFLISIQHRLVSAFCQNHLSQGCCCVLLPYRSPLHSRLCSAGWTGLEACTVTASNPPSLKSLSPSLISIYSPSSLHMTFMLPRSFSCSATVTDSIFLWF